MLTSRRIVERERANAASWVGDALPRPQTSLAAIGRYEMGASGELVHANDVWLALAGLTLDEARGNGWERVLHPDDVSTILGVWQAAVRAGQDFAYEARIVTPEGGVRWVESRATARRAADQTVQGWDGTVADITARKQAEQRIATVLDSASDGLTLTDANGQIVFASATAARMLGLHRDMIAGQPDRGDPKPAISPTGGPFPHAAPVFAQVMRTGETVRHALEYADGGRVTLCINAAPVRAPDGSVTGVVSTWRDVTEQLQAKVALARREAHLAEAQHLVHLGSWEWDIAANRMSWSDELYRIFGEEPRTVPVTWDAILERLHPDDRTRVRKIVAEVVRTGESFEFDARIRCPDGEIRFTHSRGSSVRDASGRPARLVAATLDITDRQHGAEVLRQREQEFRALVENAPDMIARFDRDLKLAYVNPATERAVGRPAVDIIGRTSQDAGLCVASDPSWELALRQVFQSKREQTLNALVEGSRGDRFYQARFTPELGEDGTVESVLCVARDMSDRKREDEERQHLYRELMEREERLHQMMEQILLGQTERRRRDRGAAAIQDLTPREREILKLVAEGHTNQQIGRAIGLSAGTVRNHVSRLLPKLGAVDRTQAAALAAEWGLLT